MCLTPYRQDVIHNLAIFLLNLKIPPLDKIYQEICYGYDTLSDLLREMSWSIATSRGFPAELGKHPSNINTRKENGGAHGHNASESHKLITLNVL